MLGYKDKTWCIDKDCKGTCGYDYLTEQEREEGTKWWGFPAFPVWITSHVRKEDADADRNV